MVLEEKVVERVGDNRTIPVDVRVITATNRDLGRMMTDGLFREDLFYRIHVVPIRLPSLRDRREDIPLLTQSFVDRLAAKTGQAIEGVTPEAMAILYRYSWPGNVRELRNTLEYAFVVRRSGWIGPEHLPENIVFSGDDSTCRPKVSSGGSDSRSTGPEPPGDALQVFPHPMTPLAVPAPPSKPASTALAGSQESDERSALLAALRRAEGNQSLAARILGVSRMTVWKRMKRYGLRVERGLGDNNGA
jgi:DNA-binding NtrC family response regulator